MGIKETNHKSINCNIYKNIKSVKSLKIKV